MPDPPRDYENRTSERSSPWQFRLGTLFWLIAAAAIILVWSRSSNLESELRADLQLPTGSKLTIIDATVDRRVIGVSMESGRAMLFAAFLEESPCGSEWYIPVISTSGAPPDMPEGTMEYQQSYDHYPTAAEIKAFREIYGLNP